MLNGVIELRISRLWFTVLRERQMSGSPVNVEWCDRTVRISRLWFTVLRERQMSGSPVDVEWCDKFRECHVLGMFWAIVRGTPTWSTLRLGSGVMTVLAEKSTRFPIRFPRTLPSLPFSLCFTDFSGRPDFCTACEKKSKKKNKILTGGGKHLNSEVNYGREPGKLCLHVLEGNARFQTTRQSNSFFFELVSE